MAQASDMLHLICLFFLYIVHDVDTVPNVRIEHSCLSEKEKKDALHEVQDEDN